MDRMPIFLRALEKGAKEAGLAVDEIGLDKLMEQGKLTLDIIPFVSKALSEIARNNNAVEKAVTQNFAPAMGRASNALKDVMNSVFKGLKPALVSLLNSFSEIGGESRNLAKVLGTTVGAAIMGLTFPIGLLVSVVLDLMDIFQEITGISDETANGFWTFASAAIGTTLGLMGLFKIVKMVLRGVKFLTGGIGKLTTATTQASTAVGGLTSKAKGALSIFSRLFGVITSVMAVWDARPGGDLSATSLFGDNAVTKWLDTPIGQMQQNKTPEIKLDVKVGVDENGNLNPYITGKVEESYNNMMIGTYNNYSPSP